MADYLEELVQKITTRADLKGFDDLEKRQKRAEKNSQDLQNSSNRAFNDIERGSHRASGAVTTYERSVRRAQKSTEIFGKFVRRTIGIFFGIQGVRSIIQTSREFDLLQRSISGLTGSTQDWEYLRKEAYRTGTDLTKAAGAYKNFYSAANMAGFDKGAVQGMFSDVLTAGRGIGANQQQIGAALMALEQMLSKGKVSMEELRRQMGNALPGSFEIAAKAMGVTTQEFNKMLEAGLDANEFVPRFTKALKENLGKGFNENIKSLDYALVNLNNAWREFQANILQGEAGEALAQLVRDITSILRSQELLNFIKLIGQGLSFIIKHVREIAILWSFSKFIRLIKYIREVDKAITATRISTGLLDYHTKALMFSYRWLAQGKVGLAFSAITKAIWGSIGATAALAAQWVGILGTILMIQDVITWLFDRDKTIHTFTGYLLNRGSSIKDMSDAQMKNPLKDISNPSDQAKADKFFEANPNLKIEYDKRFNGAIAPWYMQPNYNNGVITGGAAPIVNTNVQTPTQGYFGALPNLTGEYQSSKTQSNNITININAPNSQPETIAQSVEDALADFFNTYKESYA